MVSIVVSVRTGFLAVLLLKSAGQIARIV